MTQNDPYNLPGNLLRAILFAAEKHRSQRRKGAQHDPYINHPIAVAEILWRVGGIRDEVTLLAAILHDTVEDTDTTPQELDELFGPQVRAVVMEATDDKSLPKAERKRLQIVNAPHKSISARAVKIADKISNLHDITYTPPPDWSEARIREYVLWSGQVVDGLRGFHPALEAAYDEAWAEAKSNLGAFLDP
ncbi:MAG: HD domain-containing protein [Anaerolineales bacterium]|nr:HD domain-containing protein [Anaerolineales bacterium]